MQCASGVRTWGICDGSEGEDEKGRSTPWLHSTFPPVDQEQATTITRGERVMNMYQLVASSGRAVGVGDGGRQTLWKLDSTAAGLSGLCHAGLSNPSTL